VIVIPGDIALQKAVHEELRISSYCESRPHVRPADGVLRELAALLNSSKKVTILGGAGCAGSHDELMTLAGKLKSPIVHAMRGKEFIEYDNPYDVGMTGLLGFSRGYYAMKECDTLLMLGTDFPYQQFYPEDAKIVQVDIRPEQIGRRTRIDLGVIGNIQDTIIALLPLLTEKANGRHLERSQEDYREARKGLDDLAKGTPGNKLIHPQFLAKELDLAAAADAIFTVDVGTPVIWAARYLKMNGMRRLLGSFSHGSMASALPQAIGAKISHPGRQVVTLSGDGGFAMLMGDLLTLRQLNLPVKIVIFDNSSLGFVELEMKATGFLDYGVELKNPDFSKIAEGAGIMGIRCESPRGGASGSG
jgi:pyruvate dehydrogenase (quinone)